MSEIGAELLRESARFLRDVYVPRLRRAAEILPTGALWRRPHPEAISFGTILLHLEGNVRQWLLAGLGGRRDERDRAAEFAAEGGPGADELLEALERTVREAAALLEGLAPQRLLERLSIQGFEVTALHAVYHVVEHFAWHTGQAVWIAKAAAGAGHGLAFYDEARVNRARNAPAAGERPGDDDRSPPAAAGRASER